MHAAVGDLAGDEAPAAVEVGMVAQKEGGLRLRVLCHLHAVADIEVLGELVPVRLAVDVDGLATPGPAGGVTEIPAEHAAPLARPADQENVLLLEHRGIVPQPLRLGESAVEHHRHDLVRMRGDLVETYSLCVEDGPEQVTYKRLMASDG